jgi:hypothetical protein
MNDFGVGRELQPSGLTGREIEPHIIQLQKKRTMRSILFQHAAEGIAIWVTALGILLAQTGIYPILTILQAAAATGLIVAIVIEFVHIRKGHLSKFPAAELMASLVFLLEGIDKFLEGHVALSIAWSIVAILTMASGFIKPLIPKIRRIVFDSNGIFIKTSLFGKYEIRWSNLRLIKLSDSKIEIIARDGNIRGLRLASLLHSQEILHKFKIGLEKFKVPLEMIEFHSDRNNSTPV